MSPVSLSASVSRPSTLVRIASEANVCPSVFSFRLLTLIDRSLSSVADQLIGRRRLKNDFGRSFVSSSDSLRFSPLDRLSLGLRFLSPRSLLLLLSDQISSLLLPRQRSNLFHSFRTRTRTMETLGIRRREVLLSQSESESKSDGEKTSVCPSASAFARRSSVDIGIESSVDRSSSPFSAGLRHHSSSDRERRRRSSLVHRISFLQRFSSGIKNAFLFILSQLVCSMTVRKSICSVL